MQILVDYRPALRERTGVGEYIHQLARAYAAAFPGEIALFTSSWKDRPAPGLAGDLQAPVIDRRVPVRMLNRLWHRAGWPPIELLAGRFDVVHAAHPLLIPARHAAQVVTIHDLFFLTEPQRMHAEIRRDYPALTGAHARRADAVVTSTEYGRRIIGERLGVLPDRIFVCPPGAPEWETLGRTPRTPAGGYVLFMGTLERRKNLGALLDAYETLQGRIRPAPPLILAGRSTADADGWLRRIAQPPLSGHVQDLGYVPGAERERLYAGARVLVLPSLEEGFGLPVLEAMSAGVPVVASNRGSLPEVLGGAGALVEPDDVSTLADALERVILDESAAQAMASAGLNRARAFRWDASAAALRRAYQAALARRMA